MIRQTFYLLDWDWYVIVFYAVTTYYMDEILGELEEIGCSDSKLKEIEKSLVTEQYNNMTIASPFVFVKPNESLPRKAPRA